MHPSAETGVPSNSIASAKVSITSQTPAIMCLTFDEVDAPDVIARLRPRSAAEAVLKRDLFPSRLLLRYPGEVDDLRVNEISGTAVAEPPP